MNDGAAAENQRIDHARLLDALEKSRAAPHTAYAQVIEGLEARLKLLEADNLGARCQACRQNHDATDANIARLDAWLIALEESRNRHYDRLDTAFQRIEQLERDVAALRMPVPDQTPPVDPISGSLHPDTAREVGWAKATDPACQKCGARPGDEYASSSGHFLVNDQECPRAAKP